jgi:hypothetical protein
MEHGISPVAASGIRLTCASGRCGWPGNLIVEQGGQRFGVVTRVARELGIGTESLHGWLKQADTDHTPPAGELFDVHIAHLAVTGRDNSAYRQAARSFLWRWPDPQTWAAARVRLSLPPSAIAKQTRCMHTRLRMALCPRPRLTSLIRIAPNRG